ncbi:mechanosensitive ion channel, partial [Candidatus Sumerlaeota bacterium]|nr:mechanosensitive ion channel [Candidatus Sumerlaeota bacterium]
MTVLETSFLGNALKNWLIAAVLTAISYAGLRIARQILVRRVFPLVEGADETNVHNLFGTLARKISPIVLVIAALYFGSLALALGERPQSWITTIVFVAALIQAATWGNSLITFWIACYQQEYLEKDPERVTTIRAVGFVGRLALYSLVLLLALDNIPGVQLTALLASLGVGGVAVALSVQNILADLFASLSITLDKPFFIGDFIVVGDRMGTVEHIGLKTTRLRSLSGEQLVFSNSD